MASPRALKRRTQGHVFAAASGASNAIGERIAPAKARKAPAEPRASSSATSTHQGDAPTFGFSRRSKASIMRLKSGAPNVDLTGALRDFRNTHDHKESVNGTTQSSGPVNGDSRATSVA